jgi:8-oxo-dGTP diphosphatase
MYSQELLRSSYGASQVIRLVVGGVLRRRTNGGFVILLLTRVVGDEYGGLEELPSGAVEPGETLGEALAREVREETGLSIRATGPFLFDFTYSSRQGSTVQLNFLIEVTGDQPVRIDPAAHASFRWLPLMALADSGLSPDVRRGLVRTLGARPRPLPWAVPPE